MLPRFGYLQRKTAPVPARSTSLITLDWWWRAVPAHMIMIHELLPGQKTYKPVCGFFEQTDEMKHIFSLCAFTHLSLLHFSKKAYSILVTVSCPDSPVFTITVLRPSTCPLLVSTLHRHTPSVKLCRFVYPRYPPLFAPEMG